LRFFYGFSFEPSDKTPMENNGLGDRMDIGVCECSLQQKAPQLRGFSFYQKHICFINNGKLPA
jgi:hypothetical protein